MVRLSASMSAHDLVVIGGSAGALQALTKVVAELPPSLPACVLVALHIAPAGDGVLPGVLERATSLPVSWARNHDPIIPGRVYVAVPDFHLVVTSSGLRVVHGPRENGFRPAIDPLFRTAAREFGPRVVGVILSGGLSDGAYGLKVIKQCGGRTIVQDPSDAIVPSMPANALRGVKVDYVQKASDIAATIERLSADQADEAQSAGEGEGHRLV
jgi:two-component system chemotaxis response regulator CheB